MEGDPILFCKIIDNLEKPVARVARALRLPRPLQCPDVETFAEQTALDRARNAPNHSPRPYHTD
jgi:hypothetical protein